MRRRTGRRLVRDQRGAAYVEALVLAPFLLVAWGAVHFAYTVSDGSVTLDRKMRKKSWKSMTVGCEEGYGRWDRWDERYFAWGFQGARVALEQLQNMAEGAFGIEYMQTIGSLWPAEEEFERYGSVAGSKFVDEKTFDTYNWWWFACNEVENPATATSLAEEGLGR